MTPNAEKLVARIAQARDLNLDTATAIANTALENGDRLLALTLNTCRALMLELGASANAAMDVKQVAELIKLETALSWRLVDKSAEATRTAFEIIAGFQQTTLDLLEPRISEFNRELIAQVESAADSVKPGSNLAFAAVMSGLEVAKGVADAVESAAEAPIEAPAEARHAARKTA